MVVILAIVLFLVIIIGFIALGIVSLACSSNMNDIMSKKEFSGDGGVNNG